MCRRKGFSLIELLIVVTILLVLLAIAIPNLLRARIAANEASAIGSLRTINSAMIMYSVGHPTTGYANNLSALGSTPCTPTATIACLIDGVLASGAKSGYKFTATGSTGTPALTYYATAIPVSSLTGTKSYCSVQDAVIRVDPGGTLPGSDVACQALSALGSETVGAASGAGGGGGGGGGNGNSGNGNNGNGNGNGGGNNSGNGGGKGLGNGGPN